MRKAIIYVRVSTDEQAEKGYSLKHQEDRLRQYCQQQQIEIVEMYSEDHSAKSFERPAFIQLLAFLKKSKGRVDLLLFLKWDRFSRNAGDAYGMINQLNRLGVEPQAIEQPLDLTIPENKIMLAFYLAAPEVENDRRSLNTIAGMRRAIKEGRHCTLAPKGYRNARNEQNRPIIIPGKDASHIQFAFEKMATGLHPVQEVLRLVNKRGFNCSKNQLWRILRNPFYYGKILLPAYKDEEEAIIQGQHEPLVSEVLFNDVQDVLDGRKKNHPSRQRQKEELPLRGFLLCGICGKQITGSGSKGNGGVYFYYHCRCGCKERYKAEEANGIFEKGLHEFSAEETVIDLYMKILEDRTRLSVPDKQKALQELQQEIDKNTARLKEAQQMRLDKEMDMEEYKGIKSIYEPIIKNLISQQKDLAQSSIEISKYIVPCTDLLKNLPGYYANATLQGKRLIIGSIFSGKLIFEKNYYRTTGVDPVFEEICSTSAGSGGNKNGTFRLDFEKSHEVPGMGVEPTLPLRGTGF